MFKATIEHRPSPILDDYIEIWIDAFILDRRAQGMTRGTISFYTYKLKHFTEYCEGQAVKRITQITPALIREYLLWLEQKRNPGGVHAHFRTLRTFLYWYEEETEPEGWKNPIRKIKAPRLAVQPLEGVSLDTIMQLVKVCVRGAFTGDRDIAILFVLFDTGCRAREFLSVDLEDTNQASGEVLIRSGKGRKPRYVFIGKTARKALRRYLKYRTDTHPALWVTRDGARLEYAGLRSLITRRAKQAKIKPPSIHDFRRGFALAMLRNGIDIFTLAKLMGHADISVLQRYLKQTDQDVKLAHRKHSPLI